MTGAGSLPLRARRVGGNGVTRAWGCLLSVLFASAALGAAPAGGPYDPGADPLAQLRSAGAAAGPRRILAVVGGNWCGWCRALDRLMTSDPSLRDELTRHFVVVHVNVSKENRNADALARLDHPERLGFPALVVLSPALEILTLQSSEPFESGDPKTPGHDPARLLAFLRAWEPPPTGRAPAPR